MFSTGNLEVFVRKDTLPINLKHYNGIFSFFKPNKISKTHIESKKNINVLLDKMRIKFLNAAVTTSIVVTFPDVMFMLQLQNDFINSLMFLI
jgi:hypothetical protein